MREHSLGGGVLLRGREDDPRRAPRRDRGESGVQQRSAYSVASMIGVDDNVMQDTGGSAQRCVVVSIDAGVAVGDHGSVALGDEDDDVRLLELRAEPGAVSTRCARAGCDEPLGIEAVMHSHEKRTEPPEGDRVRRGGCADAALPTTPMDAHAGQ